MGKLTGGRPRGAPRSFVSGPVGPSHYIGVAGRVEQEYNYNESRQYVSFGIK